METKKVKSDIGDVSTRVKNTRKEIQELKSELEKLITSGINNSSKIDLSKSDQKEHLKKPDSSITEDLNEAKVKSCVDTDLQPKHIQEHHKSDQSKQLPITGITLKKKDQCLSRGTTNETSMESDLPKRSKSYNIRETREYIKKQREKRKEELKSKIKTSQATVDLKKEKLRQLHEKSLLLVSRNLQQKREKVKSSGHTVPQKKSRSSSCEPILENQYSFTNRQTESTSSYAPCKNVRENPLYESSKPHNIDKNQHFSRRSRSSDCQLEKTSRRICQIPAKVDNSASTYRSEDSNLQKGRTSFRRDEESVKATLVKKNPDKYSKVNRINKSLVNKEGTFSSLRNIGHVEQNHTKLSQLYKKFKVEPHYLSKQNKNEQSQNLLKTADLHLKDHIESDDHKMDFQIVSQTVSKDVDKISLESATVRHISDTCSELVPYLSLGDEAKIHNPLQYEKTQIFHIYGKNKEVLKSKSEHELKTDKMHMITVRHMSDTQSKLVPYLSLGDEAKIHSPLQYEKTQIFHMYGKNKGVLKNKSEHELKTNVYEKPTKDTQTIDTVYKLESPIWLEPPNNLNFINIVKHKLKSSLYLPESYKDVGIQSSLLDKELRVGDVYNRLRSSENEDFKKEVGVEIKDNPLVSDLNIPNECNLELKSFLSHECIDMRELDNAHSFKQKDKDVSSHVPKKKTVNTNTDSDTSKNIPDISTEISSFCPTARSKTFEFKSETNNRNVSVNSNNDGSKAEAFPQTNSEAASNLIQESISTQKINSSYSSDFVPNSLSSFVEPGYPIHERRKHLIVDGKSFSVLEDKSNTEKVNDMSSGAMPKYSMARSEENDDRHASNMVSSEINQAQTSVQTLQSENIISEHLNSTISDKSKNIVTSDLSNRSIICLKEPVLSLQKGSVDIENDAKSTKRFEHLFPTQGGIPSKLSKDNSNEIHLKFETEVHLLNDFNESLMNFMKVEKAFENLKQKTDLNLSKTVYENKNTQTSFSIGSPGTSKVAKNYHLEGNTHKQISTINYSRGTDIVEDLEGNSCDGIEKEGGTIMSITGLTGLEVSNISEANETVNSPVDSRSVLSSKGNSISSLSLKMFEQLIKEEDVRIENLKTIIKIREKSLLDRTRAELAFLEVQRKHLKETGQLDKASDIRKKQRGIILKHQHERHEMQKLKQIQKTASEERKLMLKEQSRLIKAQLSTKMSKIKMSPRSRRQSGPLKVIQNQMEIVWPETSVSRSSVKEDIESNISNSTRSLSEAVASEQLLSEPVEKEHLSKIKQNLLKREADLQKRRKATEQLLRWHQKLLEEEKKISELESIADIIISQIPHKHNAKKYNLKGPQLSHSHQNVTARQDKKILDNKKYSLSETALEKLYLHPTTTSIKKCVCNKNDIIGDTSQLIKSQSVSNISEKSASHTGVSSVYTEVESQVDDKSKFADNLDVYTSEFDDDSIRYSSDHKAKQFELNRISSIGELIDNFSKIREEISCLSRTTEKDISLISSNCILDTENSHSENDYSLEIQLPKADDNICDNQSATIISDQKSLIMSEKCSNADEISDLKTSTVKSDYMELNENLSEERENKTIEYGIHITSSETPRTTSSVPISPFSSSECNIDVNKEIKKSTKSSLEHLKSVSEEILSEQQSFKSVSIPTANEDEVKTISIENKLIESLEKSMSLDETVNAAEYETPQVLLHTLLLGGTAKTDTLNHSEIEELSHSLRISNESSKENDPDISPNDAITMNVSLLNPVEDILKATDKNSSEIGHLSTVEESLSTGLLEKNHGTEEQVSGESYTKLSELISFQNERVPPEEEVEILTTKNHESETQITDIESKRELTELDSRTELKLLLTTSQNQEISKDSTLITLFPESSESRQKSDCLPESVDEDVTHSAAKSSQSVSLNKKQNYQNEDIICSDLGDDSKSFILVESDPHISQADASTEKDILTLASVECTVPVSTESTEEKVEQSDIETNKVTDLVAIENEPQIKSPSSESQQREHKENSSVDTEIFGENTNLSSTNGDSEKITESLPTETEFKHVDVENSISEILVETSQVLEEDKSPRIQDIYGPTYDVLSPSSSPELDFPENRMDQKLTPDNILSDEAKQLMLKQLAIEKEIQQIEQQQKEQLPYVPIREIPNKPPPPYTPPSQAQKKNYPSVLPEEEDIQEVTKYAANVLHKAYLSNNLLNIRLKECNFKLFSKRNISKHCCELLLDLCTQLAIDHYRQFIEPDGLSWLKIYKKLQLTVVKPYDMKALENYLREKLKEYFGFTETEMKESAIIKWSRKKRDHVDEILISESQQEELEWISYDKDEFLTKDSVVNDIMNMLLSETADVFSKLVSKKTFAH